MKLRPYAILLGGKHSDALLELHDLKLVMAESQPKAFKAVANLWFGDPATAHVDAWQDLSQVDGHVFADASDAEKAVKLYFVNMGAYQKGVFAEEHHYFFVIASSINGAKQKAKLALALGRSLPHVDNAELIDDIIEIENISGQKLYWKKTDNFEATQIECGYWPLQKYQSS